MNSVGFAEWRNERAAAATKTLGHEKRALLEHSTGVTEDGYLGAGAGAALRMSAPPTSVAATMGASRIAMDAQGTRAVLCHSGNSMTLFEKASGSWSEVATHVVANGSVAFPTADADTILRGAILSADGETIAVLVRSLDGGSLPILTAYVLSWSDLFTVAAAKATSLSGEEGSIAVSGDASRVFFAASASNVVHEFVVATSTTTTHTIAGATVGAATVAGGTFGRALATDFFGLRLALKGADDLVVVDRTAIDGTFGSPMTVAVGSWTPAAAAAGVAMTWDGKSVFAIATLVDKYGLVRFDIVAGVLTPRTTDVYVMGASADLAGLSSAPAVVAATPDARFVAVALGNNGGAAEMSGAVVVTADTAKTVSVLSYVHALDARGNAFQIDTRTEFPGNNGTSTGVSGAVRYIASQAVLGRTILPWAVEKAAATMDTTTELASVTRNSPNLHQTVDARESLFTGVVKDLAFSDPEQICFAKGFPMIHRFTFRPRETFSVPTLKVKLPAHGIMALYINKRLIAQYSKSDLAVDTTVYAPADLKAAPLLATASLAQAFENFPFEEDVTYEIEILTGLLTTATVAVARIPIAETFLGAAEVASAIRVGQVQYFEIDPVQIETTKAGFDPYAEPATSVWAVENIDAGIPGDSAQVFLNGTYLVARTAAGKYYVSNRVLDQGTTGSGFRAFRMTGPAAEFITNDRQAADRGYQVLYLRAENGAVGTPGVSASVMSTFSDTVLDNVRAFTTSVATNYTYSFALAEGETNIYTISYATARPITEVLFDYFFGKALATADGDITVTVESRFTDSSNFATLTTHTIAGATTGDRLALGIPVFTTGTAVNIYQLRIVLTGATLEDADIGVIYAK